MTERAFLPPTLSDEARVAALDTLRNPDSEGQIVSVIRGHLLTPAQRLALANADLDVADVLNGRYFGKDEELVNAILTSWNEALGEAAFFVDI